MFSFPSSRKLLVPAASLLLLVLIYKLLISNAPSRSRAAIARNILSQIPRGTLIQDENTAQYLIPTPHTSEAHLSPPPRFYYDRESFSNTPPDLTHLKSLLACTSEPNPYTNHVRLPNLVFNVSSTPPGAEPDNVHKFNPTIIALPYWSPNHYLLVSRVVTEGLHQESILCEANICHPTDTISPSLDTQPCTPSDLSTLGPSGGLRCATIPVIINNPPTPAERCTGAWTAFPSIPGFHDPRIFWSGKNEPLIIVNSASRYGCVGLWIADLRSLYKPLDRLLKGHDGSKEGPLMSYPRLTELTRNPRQDRSPVEKNWMLFFPSREEVFIHYDMVGPNTSSTTSGRSFAKLIGNGYTTPNLADPNEASCFTDTLDSQGRPGHWHQGSNALKLVLCTRKEAIKGSCHEDEVGRSVHLAVMHRKFSNAWHLPLRYERWFVVWEGSAPWRLLAKSRCPVLMANETASGWSGEENWEEGEMGKGAGKEVGRRDWQKRRWINGSFLASNTTNPLWLNDSSTPPPYLGDHSNPTNAILPIRSPLKQNWAYFTYTPSIAWAWRPKSAETRREDRDGGAHDGSYLHSLNVGYLDDEVIVGIGLLDEEQAFARAQARVLLQCLKTCGGVGGGWDERKGEGVRNEARGGRGKEAESGMGRARKMNET
jgi:hypothetical protein